MSSTNRLDVVVCSYAGDVTELTLDVLRRAAGQAEGDGQTLLIDMSPDDTITAPAAEIPGVTVHHVPDSNGLGESRQVGLERSDARYVAFIDSDAPPRPQWRAALHRAVEADDVAIAGGPVIPIWPRRPPRLFRAQTAEAFLSMFDLGPDQLEVPRVLPGNMAIDRELTTQFQRHLGRKEGQLVSAEETQLMIDAKRDGWRILYVPDAAVDHHTRPDRLNWRWMWRRAFAGGREAAMHGPRLEPIPRDLGLIDYAFLASITVPFFAGRARERYTARTRANGGS